MKTYSLAMLFLGLIFDIILILFVIISILLIYSLLMISVETKTFDNGLMRLVGLSKCGYVAMVLTQALMFILPALIFGLILSMPCLWILYQKLFTADQGYTPSIIPSSGALI